MSEMKTGIQRLWMENEFLENISGFLCQDSTRAEKITLIGADIAVYLISWVRQYCARPGHPGMIGVRMAIARQPPNVATLRL